jgi:phosphatidate cytidylyltransferase
MLQVRVISTLIAIPIVVFGTIYGGWMFYGGATLIALIAGWEFSQMMKNGGYHTTTPITLALIALLVSDSYFTGFSQANTIITFGLLASVIWQLFKPSRTPSADWALTMTGGLYIGWGMGHLVLLRGLGDGLYLIFLTMVCTWASDMAAYFTGHAIGKHKLWPRHSPNKTWEGLFGGIVASLVVATAFALWGTPGWPLALVIGVVIPVAGLAGDLAISLLKRDVGLKDTSNLFPGHGGFLDRLDSLLFGSIVVYYLAVWLG